MFINIFYKPCQTKKFDSSENEMHLFQNGQNQKLVHVGLCLSRSSFFFSSVIYYNNQQFSPSLGKKFRKLPSDDDMCQWGHTVSQLVDEEILVLFSNIIYRARSAGQKSARFHRARIKNTVYSLTNSSRFIQIPLNSSQRTGP